MVWFDCAQRRPISANTGGRLSPNLGLVLHHAVADGSLYSFFNSPSAEVSAHFWVAKSGAIEQYVDTDVVAWHGKQLNSRYVGVETEGCSAPPHAEPFTSAQVNGLAAIYAEGMRRHGWPNRLSNADGQPGFGFHRMAVNTACPCDIRLNRRQDILNIASGGQPLTPIPTEESDDMIASTASGKGYWTVTKDGAVYAFGDAQFRGSRFPEPINGRIIGIAGKNNDGYWLLASDGGIFTYGSAEFYGRPDRT